MIADLRKRLAELPPELALRVDRDLKTSPIEHVLNFLWKAGFPFETGHMYEYRKTFFPPNAMIDGLTAGPPVLRPEFAVAASCPPPQTQDRPQPSPDHAPVEPSPEMIAMASPSEPPAAELPERQTFGVPPLGGLVPAVPAPATSEARLDHPGPGGDHTSASQPPLIVSEPSRGDHGSLTVPPAKNPSIQESTNQESNPSTHESSVNPSVARAVARKRRGKIASLPKELRDELNARLETNDSYETIVRWLARNGHPGFNKQNLHLWKEGGYQDWRRENERIQTQVMQREWLNEQVAQTKPGELFLLIDQLFVTQLLDSLFGLDTGLMKKGLAASPRHFISLFSAYNRFKRDAMNSEEFHAFLEQQTRLKQPRGGMTDDVRQAILNELRIFFRPPLADPGEPQPPNPVKHSQG